MGLSPRGAAFSLSEPKSGEGQDGGGVDGCAEKSGSKRLRRLSLGRFIVAVCDALATRRLSGSWWAKREREAVFDFV